MKMAIMFLAGLASLISVSAQAELKTVPYVDVAQYLGDWYQISHVPLWFEGNNDCPCARQRLTPTSNGSVVGVVNTCTQSDGSLYTIKGTATNVEPKSNSKFTVRFEGVSFEGSYWIIGLDPQYRYAVVSDRNEYSLYILSKTPTISKALYQEAVALAAKQLDVSKLKITSHKNCTYPK